MYPSPAPAPFQHARCAFGAELVGAEARCVLSMLSARKLGKRVDQAQGDLSPVCVAIQRPSSVVTRAGPVPGASATHEEIPIWHISETSAKLHVCRWATRFTRPFSRNSTNSSGARASPRSRSLNVCRWINRRSRRSSAVKDVSTWVTRFG